MLNWSEYCEEVPIKVPHKVPYEECYDVPKKHCTQIPIHHPHKKCKKHPKKKCFDEPYHVPYKVINPSIICSLWKYLIDYVFKFSFVLNNFYKFFWIIWRKRSSGFLRIFTVAFFLTPAGGSNPAGLIF